MVRMPRASHVRRRGSCFAVPRLAYQGLAVGGWPLAVGGAAVGGWRLAVGGWRLALGPIAKR